VRRSEEIAGEANQILEPHRLESQFRPELAKLVGDFILEEVIAGHDGHWREALFIFGTQATKEAKAIDERHSKIQDDGVGAAFFGDAQAVLGGDGRTHLIPLQPQHAGKRLGDAFIVIDDEDFRGNRGNGLRRGCRHPGIVTDVVGFGHKTKRVQPR
jgi:hypothetical protein